MTGALIVLFHGLMVAIGAAAAYLMLNTVGRPS